MTALPGFAVQSFQPTPASDEGPDAGSLMALRLGKQWFPLLAWITIEAPYVNGRTGRTVTVPNLEALVPGSDSFSPSRGAGFHLRYTEM